MFAALGILTFTQRIAAWAVIGIALGGGLAVFVHARDLGIKHAAAAERDKFWTEKMLQAERDRQTLQRRVDGAADRERAASEATFVAAERAAQLERDLAALKADPIVWPRSIARALRQ